MLAGRSSSAVGIILLLSLVLPSFLGEVGVHAQPGAPEGFSLRQDEGWNRAVELRWTPRDDVMLWKVERSCGPPGHQTPQLWVNDTSSSSASPSGSTKEPVILVISVAEAELVDYVREEGSCAYRVQACDVDGCGNFTNPVIGRVGSVPGAPAKVVAVQQTGAATLTVRYQPPLDTGVGNARSFVLTNFRVEFSLNSTFPTVDYSTESGDGAVWVQSYTFPKGETVYTRVRAANTLGWGEPTLFANADGSARGTRAIVPPGPPTRISAAAAEDDGAVVVTYTQPLDTGAWDTSEPIVTYLIEMDDDAGFESIDSVVEGASLSMMVVRLTPGVRYHVRVRAANAVGYGRPATMGGLVPTTVLAISAPSAPIFVGGYASAPSELTWRIVAPLDWGSGNMMDAPLHSIAFQVSTDPAFLFVNASREVLLDPIEGTGGLAYAQDGISLDNQVYSISVSGLTSGAMYYARAMAVNSLGAKGRAGSMGHPGGDALQWPYHLSNAQGPCGDPAAPSNFPKSGFAPFPLQRGCGTAAPATFGWPQMSKGLRALYTFDQDPSRGAGADSSGYSMHGNVMGNATVAAGGGYIQAGLRLDMGSGGEMSCLVAPNTLRTCLRAECVPIAGGRLGECEPPACSTEVAGLINAAARNGFGSWTINMWATFDNVEKAQAIIVVPPEGGGGGDLTDSDMALFMEGGRLSIILMGALYDRELSLADGGTLEESLAGVPIHIAVVYNASALELNVYTGGRWSSGFSNIPPIHRSAGPLIVGHCNCTYKGQAPQMVGNMDSLRFYDLALSEDQVYRLHTLPQVAPSLEQPFPVQAISHPSEPAAIESVRVSQPGVLSVTIAPPLDPGSGNSVSCPIGAPPPCTSVIRYKLQLDDDPDFNSITVEREFVLPEFGGEGGARFVNGTGKYLTQGGTGTTMGASADDFSDAFTPTSFLHLWVEDIPVSQWLYLRVMAANVVGYGPPQTLSLNGTEPTSVRMNGHFYMERVKQGVYLLEPRTPPDAFWGEL